MMKQFKLLILFFGILFFNNSYLFSQEKINEKNEFKQIDLTTKDIYIRKGFQKEWLNQLPDENDKNWYKVKGLTVNKSVGNRPIHIKDLPLKNIPKRHFLSLKEYKPQTFTFITSFNISKDQLKNIHSLGLFLGSIGQNWEIYLNGNLLKKAIYLDKRGEIQIYRTVRDLLIPFDLRYLKSGQNILSFKIIGDPTNMETGFFIGRSQLINKVPILERIKSEKIALILVFIYFFLGLYHLLLFRKRQDEKYNLFFGVFDILLFVYLFSKTNTIFDVILNSNIIFKLEYFDKFFIIPFLLFFYESLLYEKVRKISKYYLLFSSILAVLILLTSRTLNNDILRIWQLTILISAYYILVTLIGSKFIKEIKKTYKSLKKKSKLIKILISISKTLIKTEVGNLLIGTFTLVFAAIFDVLDSMFWGTGIGTIKYGFFFFVIGIAVMLANKFLNVYQEVEKLNNDLDVKNKALVRLDKLKDEFLANTSHELQTPLTGIIGLTESTLEKAKINKKLSKNTFFESMQMITASARRLASLVNDILDFSKLKNANLDLNVKPVDTYQVAKMTMMLAETMLSDKNIQMKIDFDDNLPLVYADDNRLQQVLLNLLSNAIKFTKAGSITLQGKLIIEESENPTEENRQFVKISVIDTGIGIPQEKQDKIFESFEQADGSTSREFGGTGLGLTIVKKLLELHGTDIELESKENEGSKFSFILYIAEDVDVTQALKNQKKELSDEEKAKINSLEALNEFTEKSKSKFKDFEKDYSTKPIVDNKKKIILIVDDEPINIMVLEDYLKSDDIEIVSALSGAHALEIIEYIKPNMVLLDIMMPRMSGYEVLEKIREMYPITMMPVIFISAKNQKSDKKKGLDLGANDYLTKPFNKEEVLTRVNLHMTLFDSVEAQIEQSNAFHRFVPFQFLEMLGVSDPAKLRLGDSTSSNMSILFSDIRSFTTLSESMNINDNFKFLNSYLKRMTPAIRNNRGFVDKFIGDAVMALFPNLDKKSKTSADLAVNAAIQMRKELTIYNKDRMNMGYMPIDIGIGINTGELMLGTVGGRDRIETTVIGNNVNLASRLESLTSFYRCRIIISDYTYRQLTDRSSVKAREIDSVTAKGMKEPVVIYEIYAADDEKEIELKDKTQSNFMIGIIQYKSRQFEDAIEQFQMVLNENPRDQIARLYIRRCDEFIVHPPDANWKGVIEMRKK